MIRMIGPINTGAAAGGAGVATANDQTKKPIVGKLLAAYVKYNGSPPAGTTDIVIATLGTSPSPPTQALLTLTNAATAGWFFPRIQVHGITGTALTMEGAEPLVEPFPISDIVKVTITGANDADSADVWLLLEE